MNGKKLSTGRHGPNPIWKIVIADRRDVNEKDTILCRNIYNFSSRREIAMTLFATTVVKSTPVNISTSMLFHGSSIAI